MSELKESTFLSSHSFRGGKGGRYLLVSLSLAKALFLGVILMENFLRVEDPASETEKFDSHNHRI